MSETSQPQPERIRRSTGNRSAESVNRSVGNIAARLNARAVDLVGVGSSISTNNGMSITETAHRDQDQSGYDDINVRNWPAHKVEGTSTIQVEHNRYGSRGYLQIEAQPDYVEATHRPIGGEHSDQFTITDPAMVGDVAANTLNTLRGHIAEAEIAAQRKEADAKRAVKQKMIDFVNDKKN